MNRKAFLIMNPGRPGDKNYTPSVETAYNRMKNFLKSPIGGYWNDDEILELARVENIENLQEDFTYKMETLSGADVEYSIVVFIGHGGAVNGIDSIQLEDDEIIQISTFMDIIPDTSKRTVIIDACRYFVNISQSDLVRENSILDNPKLQGTWCRDYYNRLIANAQPHVELIQSTQYGQYAHGSQTGTAFIDAFLDIVKANNKIWNVRALIDSEFTISYPDVEVDIKQRMGKYNQVPQYTNKTDSPFPLLALKKPNTGVL